MEKMIVFGTGHAMSIKYANTAFGIYDDYNFFLVDGGGGREVLSWFVQNQEFLGRLQAGFLSHAHTDHILGMVWMMRKIAFDLEQGRREQGFCLYGEEKTLDILYKICSALLRPQEIGQFGKKIQLIAVRDGESREILGKQFTFFDIHSTKMIQFGFSAADHEKKLVFLGDEPVNDWGMKYLENADWMLSEAFCLDEEREIYHPEKFHHGTVKSASEIAQKYGVKNLVLWHTEDETTYGCKKDRYTKESRRYYTRGRVWVPDDGEIIPLG